MRIFIDAVPCLNFIYNLLAYSRGVSPDSPCRGGIPSTISSTIPNMCKRKEEGRNEIAAGTSWTGSKAGATTTAALQQRAYAGPSDPDTPQTSSPSKSRLNFLEGFRSTLRPRSPVRNNSIPVSNNTEITINSYIYIYNSICLFVIRTLAIAAKGFFFLFLLMPVAIRSLSYNFSLVR